MNRSIKKKVRLIYLALLNFLGFKIVHFIHIGKTAGTAIKNAENGKKSFFSNSKFLKNYVLIMENHDFKLMDVKNGEYSFFVIRDPISRFVSGFYSRFRMGQPRIYNPWTDLERKAFEKFATPNELGEALSSQNPEVRHDAENAMRNIKHVNSSYWDWMGSMEYIKLNKSKILFYLRQENLNEDIFFVKNNFGIDLGVLPDDNIKSHKNPDSLDKKLSDVAKENLRSWYKSEYAFVQTIEGLFDFYPKNLKS